MLAAVAAATANDCCWSRFCRAAAYSAAYPLPPLPPPRWCGWSATTCGLCGWGGRHTGGGYRRWVRSAGVGGGGGEGGDNDRGTFIGSSFEYRLPPGAIMLSIVKGLGLCRWFAVPATEAAAAVVIDDGCGSNGGSCGGGDNDCSPNAAAIGDVISLPADVCSEPMANGDGESALAATDDDRPNVASNRARSAAGSLNRLRRRKNEPFSNMSRAAGCSAQYAPLPGLSGRRGIFTKQSLNDRLCRSEFCHLKCKSQLTVFFLVNYL